jgi:ureidoglycolate lyase
MPDATMERRYLELEEATPQTLAPFGWMLAPHPDIPSRKLNFYPGERRGPADFVSDEQTELSVVQMQRRPFEVVYLERHFKHTQSFIPLGGKPFVVVMAPPFEGDLPPIESIRAFRFDGSGGFCMKLGTWHEFPFVYEDGASLIVILRKETYLNLQNVVGDEAYGDDLDKKNLKRRLGCTLTVHV